MEGSMNHNFFVEWQKQNQLELTIPAFMSEEPISTSSIVHKHHND